jgi:hypothetical protein
VAGFYDLQDEYRRQAQAGELTEALETARQMWDTFPDRRTFTWMFLAAAHAATGDLHAAAQVLRQALDTNVLWRLSLLQIPEMELVRSDPACIAVIEDARRRIELKDFRPQVVVERPPHAGIAPLLLHLHGANSDAARELPHWSGAAGLGWIVAAGQSSQPSAENLFCWDPPPERTWQDSRSIASMLPAHARMVVSGFSQGAWVALQAALRSDIFQPAGVIMVAPFLAGPERLEPSGRRFTDSHDPGRGGPHHPAAGRGDRRACRARPSRRGGASSRPRSRVSERFLGSASRPPRIGHPPHMTTSRDRLPSVANSPHQRAQRLSSAPIEPSTPSSRHAVRALY